MKFLTDILEHRKQKKLNKRCMQAAHDGDFKEMLNLITQGADLNGSGMVDSGDGRTVSFSSPAYEAIRQGNMQALSALIDNKLDVNGMFGSEPLIIQAIRTNEAAALMLLDHGARTDFILRDLKTPLKLAELYNRHAVADRLRPQAASAPAPAAPAMTMKPLALKKPGQP